MEVHCSLSPKNATLMPSQKEKANMSLTQHVRLMAHYNQWMNQKVYAAAATLPASALEQDRGAFFGSIFGTLNHIALGDTIWLKRLSTAFPDSWGLNAAKELPTISKLDRLLYSDLASLLVYRNTLDALFTQLGQVIEETDLQQTLSYGDLKGNPYKKEFFSLLMHVFNHQTHHRGQVSTLLTQAGVDIGVTDLNAIIPIID